MKFSCFQRNIPQTHEYQFDSNSHLVGIEIRLTGPAGGYDARVALDTGASFTVISKDILVLIGYDPDALPQSVHFTTGSGVASAARVTVGKIEALEQERQNLAVIAHTLPPSVNIDGLLGLDFLRGFDLFISFKTGEITLT